MSYFLKIQNFYSHFSRRNEIRAQLLDEHEADLELQLKRQAAAHSLHLTEELALQGMFQIFFSKFFEIL